jgi:hypothetical protein
LTRSRRPSDNWNHASPPIVYAGTDLFPKLKDVVSSHEYDSMAEEFEKKKHELFREDGFEKIVARVARLEQEMGIHDLDQFTPR